MLVGAGGTVSGVSQSQDVESRRIHQTIGIVQILADIPIDKNSDVPIRRQIVEQIVFLIATGKLKPGDSLQSVRQMAQRQSISANTVSAAYKELVDRHWLKRHRGSRMLVRSPQEAVVPQEPGIDDLINLTIQMARDKGYSLQDLTERVRERLLVEPPDHVLVVTREPGIGKLLLAELSDMMSHRVESCLLKDLSRNRSPAIGALVTCLPGLVWDVAPLLPGGRYAFPLKVSGTDKLMDSVKGLKQPSMIALVSISPYVLETAHALLAPIVGKQHSIEQYCLADGETKNLSGADLVICDAVVKPRVRARKVIPYRIVSSEVAAEIASAIQEATESF